MKHISHLTLLLNALAGVAGIWILFSGCAGFSGGRRVERPDTEAQQALETADTHEGIGQGYRGPIRVRVRMEGGSIAEITIIDSNEDKAVGGAAMEELLELVLLYNTTDLDAVSGASESSKGFLSAVKDAILSP
jgi:uncharacterized protein with FMN-binding domain